MATKGGFSNGWKGFVDHEWIKEWSAPNTWNYIRSPPSLLPNSRQFSE